MPSFSRLFPRTVIRLVAAMAIMGVLWSGVGIEWWVVSCDEAMHFVSSPFEKGDHDAQEEHKKEPKQDVKILNCAHRVSMPLHVLPVCLNRTTTLASLHHPEVPTPPPKG